MSRRSVIALDVGGSKIVCGLLFEDGEMVFHKKVATPQGSAEASVRQLISLIREAGLAATGEASPAAVGLVIPGWVDRSSRTVWAPNIVGWDHLPLEDKLADELCLPIVLDSDRNACVKGEAWLGVARGVRDVVFLAVGTGIGAGILASGQVLRGRDDLAGSVGWMALNPQFQDIYARIGCLEAEASGTAVGRKGSVALDGGAVGTDLTARAVIEAAASGEPRAREVLDEVIIYLGMAVANLVSLLNPEMVVLGGGLFKDGAYLLERVRQEFIRWAQPIAARRVRIELTALADCAALFGAARIAFENI